MRRPGGWRGEEVHRPRRVDHAGLPVRPRPLSSPGTGAVVALRSGPPCFQLGPGACEGGHGPEGGGSLLRDRRAGSGPGHLLDAPRVAQGVESGERSGRAVVGRELQGGIQHRPGRSGPSAGQLERVADRQAQGPEDRVSPVQVPAQEHTYRTVHHRGDPDRARPPPRHPAPAGHDPHPREHAQAPAAPRRRDGPDPVGHGPAGSGRPLACGLPGRGRAGRHHPGPPDAVAGVDLGIKHLAVIGTGPASAMS